MLRIGLTGGIGSGKSTVAGLFARRGVTIIDTDVIAHELVRPGQPALTEIERAFGPAIIDANGNLNRPKLRSLVFNDAPARHRLEAILHPRIRQAVQEQTKAVTSPYCLIVVPLLVETRFDEIVDRVLVVDVEKKQQIERTMSRNGMTAEIIEKIISAQAGRSQRLARADDIISNKGDLQQLEREVERLDAHYRTLAKG